jgi:hypothetical protein
VSVARRARVLLARWLRFAAAVSRLEDTHAPLARRALLASLVRPLHAPAARCVPCCPSRQLRVV